MFQSVQEETLRVAQEGTGLSIGGTSSPREGQDFGAVSMGPAIDHKGLDTVSNGKVCYILLCSGSLCLHLVNSLIAPLISYFQKGPALVSADEAFISISVILVPAISSTDRVYAFGEAGSTSTTGSENGFSTNSLCFNL